MNARALWIAFWGLILLCFGNAVGPKAGFADILYRHDGSPAMIGRLVSETDRQIVFLEHFQSGATKKQTLFKADVLRLVKTIDDQRLGRLNPKSPQDYYDYAEELAAHKLDFVAQQLAVRLFLLAARNSKDQLQQSSLLALHALFSEEAKRQRTRALALKVLHPRYHRPFLENRPKTQLDPSVRAKLLQVVQQIRTDRKSEAAQALKTEELRNGIKQFSRIASWQEVYRISISKKLELDQLLILVKLELALADTSNLPTESEGYRWAADAKRKEGFDASWVTFDNLTRFDPGKSVFRDGNWKAPER